MRTQSEYMDFIREKFLVCIGMRSYILDAYCYRDHRASDIIREFVDTIKASGLKFSNCYHANGIGNNNDYMIYVETKDADGFVIQKNIANFYYCFGIYGGCYVMLKDLSTGDRIILGDAR